MLAEAFLLGACLYLLIRLRPWLGNTPLVATVGTLQFVQVVLAISVYIEVLPGLLISPGSAVLFTGTILAVLLVYIVDDALGARKLIYSLFLANILLSLITLSVSTHLTGNGVHLFVDIPREIFIQHPRFMIVGTITLFLDTILVIIAYEYLTRFKSLFLRISLALSVVMIFDCLLFITGSFVENKDYLNILFSSMAGKLMMVPAAALAVALLHRIMTKTADNESRNITDFFNLLTYREKYELAKIDSIVDPLTRLFNRRAFNSEFQDWSELDSYAILMIDADRFKSINDELGHAVGDTVLKLISSAITTHLRGSDVAYRYGGEEFLVFLPYTNIEDAIVVSKRIQEALNLNIKNYPLPDHRHVTLSIGVAAAPKDGKLSQDIINVADNRLYWAKNNGRNQVVSS